MSKKKSLQKEIRDKSRRNHIQDRKCRICNTRFDIQNHHILKVARIVGFVLNHNKVKVDDVPKPTTDLCEYHHHKAHILYDDINEETTVNDVEYYRYNDMIHELDKVKQAETILDEIDKQDFDKMIEDTINVVSFNLNKYHEESELTA